MSTSEVKSKEFQSVVIGAIKRAEKNTSGEIRVHVEPNCKIDPIERAVYLFEKLKMYKTQQRNGVLIYIAYSSHKLAIVGDEGINEKVPDDFWDDVKNVLVESFAKGMMKEGIAEAISMIGRKLKVYFPYEEDDIDEQTNEISYGD